MNNDQAQTKKALLKEKLSRIKSLILIVILLIVLMIFIEQMSNQQRLNQISQKIEKLNKSVQQTEKAQLKTENTINHQTSTLNTMNQTLKQISQSIANSAQNQSNLEAKISQQITKTSQNTDKSMQTLEHILKILDTQPEHLEKSSKTHMISFSQAPEGYQKTDQYTLSGVAPYGIILQDNKGHFLIAQINKQLSVGIISVITEHYVIAGKYVITSAQK
ncbi:hypothetical protein L3V86_02485 [Thiotrichales bacterium 19S11-10]|nr:hypothetical protein [Thiotrichales bacterium 19S11-10]